VNFEEWQDELAAGHTSHAKYHDWLTEWIDDNRRLTMDAAVEEQKRDKRLLANSLAGWGNGLKSTTRVVMSKDKETSTQLQSEKAPAPAPAEEQQRNPTTSIEGPLISGLVPPDSPLLSGTVTTFPQDFNAEGTESDRLDASLGTNAGVDPTHRSFGTDADIELDYNGTSSEEEDPNSKDQPGPTKAINQNIQPVSTEPINQSIQSVPDETINQNIQPPCAQEANKKAINPAGQDENQTLTDKQSTLGNPFKPTGLSHTQWERQKSIFSNVLDGYTSPGGGQVKIHNLMMLAFTQSRDGESQLNHMAQNHAHINFMAQQQKELLEQQAATIQAGTEKVLAAQEAMLRVMESKQKENQRENDSRVQELMERLAEVEMALRREKVRSLEFEAALAMERQNKRRAMDSPEEAPVGKARSTGPSGYSNLNSAATAQRVCPLTGIVLSASGLPISRKFNPSLLLSVRS
jgi:hypothetical protein